MTTATVPSQCVEISTSGEPETDIERLIALVCRVVTPRVAISKKADTMYLGRVEFLFNGYWSVIALHTHNINLLLLERCRADIARYPLP